MRVRVVLVAMLSVSLAFATGCAKDDGGAWTGAVTTLSPVLCVGRAAAAGDCFEGASKATTAGLQVGDCVAVVFGSRGAGGRYRLRSITPVAATDHRRDCPSGGHR